MRRSEQQDAPYEAWYELFPANSVNVFAVHAGDKMDIAVSFASGKFTLIVDDLTSGKKVTHSAKCASCARTSAEYIVERPALCDNAGAKCFLTELADYHTATMGANTAQIAGGAVSSLAKFDNIPIFMIDPLKSGGFDSLDTVAPLDSARLSPRPGTGRVTRCPLRSARTAEQLERFVKTARGPRRRATAVHFCWTPAEPLRVTGRATSGRASVVPAALPHDEGIRHAPRTTQ